MKKSAKKCLALVLAVVMLMSLLAVGASAANTSDTFTDIAGSSHAKAIQELAKAGIMKGVSNTRFDPDGIVTRAMAVTVLGRMAKAEQKTSNTFNDVDNSSWYAGYVGWAAENGIVLGVGGGIFDPDRAITGQELDLMLARYAALADIDYKATNTSTAPITRGEMAEMVFYVYALPYLPNTSANVDPSVPIAVEGGQITGTLTEDSEIAMWKGIPYAAAPVGNLRWKAPQPVESWSGVKTCTEFGPSAMQGFQEAAAPYTAEFLVDFDNLSEDCLTLNVWSRAGSVAEARPVVVYIHGGGYTGGGANCEIYDGELLAREDVVYVSINYRLGIFGFMAHPDLTAEDEHGSSGNYALLDWIKALEWVQEYISEFGGDPGNVTVVGQSAGGMAINTLTSSPLAKGLFAKAFIMSGIAFSDSVGTLDDAEAAGIALCETQGKSLAELRAMPAEELQSLRWNSNGPVADGYAVLDSVTNSLLNGTANDVPLVVGMVEGDPNTFGGILTLVRYRNGMTAAEYEALLRDTFDELADRALALYPVTNDDALSTAQQVNVEAMSAQQVRYAQAKATHSSQPVYLYVDTWDYAGLAEQGAFHSSDIPYWLGGVFTAEKTSWSEHDYELADTMSSYLLNFVKTGNVNGNGLPQWSAEGKSGAYLAIGSTVEGTAFSQEKLDFWADYIEWAATRQPEENPEGPSDPYSRTITWSDAMSDNVGTLTINPATSEWTLIFDSMFGPQAIAGTYTSDGTLTVTDDGGLGGFLELAPIQEKAGPAIREMLYSRTITWSDAMSDNVGTLTINPATSEWNLVFDSMFGPQAIAGTYTSDGTLTVTDDGGLGGFLELAPIQEKAGPAIREMLYSRTIAWSDAMSDNVGTLTINPATSEWTLVFDSMFGPQAIGGTYTSDGTLTVTDDGGLGGFLDLEPIQAVAGPAILSMLS